MREAYSYSGLIAPLAKTAHLLMQTKDSHDKLYSFHEPEVSCIAKGKASSPYEFGSKAYHPYSKERPSISWSNPQKKPSQQLASEPAFSKATANTGRPISQAVVDRGFYSHLV